MCGGLIEVQYAATGFLLVRADVYQAVEQHQQLPTCNRRFGKPVVPYFLSMLIPQGDNDHWFLGEDYAFCQRARMAGYEIHADTTIRLKHFGHHGYTWEDAGSERPRYATYTYHLSSGE